MPLSGHDNRPQSSTQQPRHFLASETETATEFFRPHHSFERVEDANHRDRRRVLHVEDLFVFVAFAKLVPTHDLSLPIQATVQLTLPFARGLLAAYL